MIFDALILTSRRDFIFYIYKWSHFIIFFWRDLYIGIYKYLFNDRSNRKDSIGNEVQVCICKSCEFFFDRSVLYLEVRDRFHESEPWSFIPCRIGISLESQSLKILAFTRLMSWNRLWNISSRKAQSHSNHRIVR